jgi:hypothetical protein
LRPYKVNLRKKNLGKRICRRGHYWTEESTYVSPSGHKNCRICKSEREGKEYNARMDRRKDRQPKDTIPRVADTPRPIWRPEGWGPVDVSRWENAG